MSARDLVIGELKEVSVPIEYLKFGSGAILINPEQSRGIYPTLIFLANYAKELNIIIEISSIYRNEGSHRTNAESDLWFEERIADSKQTLAQLNFLSDVYKLYDILNCQSIRIGHYLDFPENSNIGSNTRTTGNSIIINFGTDKNLIAKMLRPAGDRGNLSGGIHFAIAVSGIKLLKKYTVNQRNSSWDRTTSSKNNGKFKSEFKNLTGNFDINILTIICQSLIDQLYAILPNAKISLK